MLARGGIRMSYQTANRNKPQSQYDASRAGARYTCAYAPARYAWVRLIRFLQILRSLAVWSVRQPSENDPPSRAWR